MQDSGDKEMQHRPRRIAMYVIYDKDGKLDRFRKYYLQELRKEVDTIVGVVSGTLTPESRDELAKLTDDFFVRENKGFLAGSWLDGIAHIGWDTLAEYDELLMLNDSFFGPFYPLSEMFDAMEKSDADFYGAMKNFEEKSYTSIAGRPMKHHHFMGSICYFYVIRAKLLHSSEFKTYWSERPKIETGWDAVFFNEVDFYDYVRDAGFRIGCYQGDALKGYLFDNLTHSMRKLVEDERIPFARHRPFCTEMLDQSLQINYGQDPRLTLEYIDRHTDYDATMIWDYILRTKNLTDIFNQLQLEYVVPQNSVETPFTYEKRIAVILHIYYEDQIQLVADYCLNFPSDTFFYITATKKATKSLICKAFNERKLQYECQVRPNIGMAMSSLWVTYSHVITDGNYEYICYFHDKKSPYHEYSIIGEQFATRCYSNLFGTPEIVKNIINIFEQNSRLGVLGPSEIYHGSYFQAALLSWSNNYKNVKEIAEKLDLDVNIDENKVAVTPYGDMFWFRADALKKAMSYGFTYDDLDVKYKEDGTLLHALERIYGFAAQDSGYYYAEVANSSVAQSDLINYRYMMQSLAKTLQQRGYYGYSFDHLRLICSKLPIYRGFDGWGRRLLHWLLNHHLTHGLGIFLRSIYRRLFIKG